MKKGIMGGNRRTQPKKLLYRGMGEDERQGKEQGRPRPHDSGILESQQMRSNITGQMTMRHTPQRTTLEDSNKV